MKDNIPEINKMLEPFDTDVAFNEGNQSIDWGNILPEPHSHPALSLAQGNGTFVIESHETCIDHDIGNDIKSVQIYTGTTLRQAIWTFTLHIVYQIGLTTTPTDLPF